MGKFNAKEYWDNYWKRYEQVDKNEKKYELFDVRDIYLAHVAKATVRSGFFETKYYFNKDNKKTLKVFVKKLDDDKAMDVITNRIYRIYSNGKVLEADNGTYMVALLKPLEIIWSMFNYTDKVTREILEMFLGAINNPENSKNSNLLFDDFIKLFIAINHIRGNDTFNIKSLENYLIQKYSEDISASLTTVIQKLLEEGILREDTGASNTIFINKGISIEKLIGNNIDHFQEVLDIVVEYEAFLSKMLNECYGKLDEGRALKK